MERRVFLKSERKVNTSMATFQCCEASCVFLGCSLARDVTSHVQQSHTGSFLPPKLQRRQTSLSSPAFISSALLIMIKSNGDSELCLLCVWVCLWYKFPAFSRGKMPILYAFLFHISILQQRESFSFPSLVCLSVFPWLSFHGQIHVTATSCLSGKNPLTGRSRNHLSHQLCVCSADTDVRVRDARRTLDVLRGRAGLQQDQERGSENMGSGGHNGSDGGQTCAVL